MKEAGYRDVIVPCLRQKISLIEIKGNFTYCIFSNIESSDWCVYME